MDRNFFSYSTIRIEIIITSISIVNTKDKSRHYLKIIILRTAW